MCREWMFVPIFYAALSLFVWSRTAQRRYFAWLIARGQCSERFVARNKSLLDGPGLRFRLKGLDHTSQLSVEQNYPVSQNSKSNGFLVRQTSRRTSSKDEYVKDLIMWRNTSWEVYRTWLLNRITQPSVTDLVCIMIFDIMIPDSDSSMMLSEARNPNPKSQVCCATVLCLMSGEKIRARPKGIS